MSIPKDRRKKREALQDFVRAQEISVQDVLIVLAEHVRKCAGELKGDAEMSLWNILPEELWWGMMRADVDNVALYRLLRSKELVTGNEERRARMTVGERISAMAAELITQGHITVEEWDEAFLETAYFLAEKYVALGLLPRGDKSKVMEMFLRKLVPPGTRPGDPSNIKDEPEV